MRRELELGCESWTSFASSCSSTAVQRTLSLWLCPSTAVETAIAQCTSRCAMARGHRLNTSIVLAAVHGLSALFRAVSAIEPSLFRPLPPPLPVPVPNKPPRFCGRKAKWSWSLSSHKYFTSAYLLLRVDGFRFTGRTGLVASYTLSIKGVIWHTRRPVVGEGAGQTPHLFKTESVMWSRLYTSTYIIIHFNALSKA